MAQAQPPRILPSNPPPPASGNGDGKQEYLVVYRPNDNLTLSISQITQGDFTTAELGILIYMLALMQERPQREFSIWSVVEHFKHDEPLTVLYTLKGLVAKGMLEDSDELNTAVMQTLKNTHTVETH